MKDCTSITHISVYYICFHVTYLSTQCGGNGSKDVSPPSSPSAGVGGQGEDAARSCLCSQPSGRSPELLAVLGWVEVPKGRATALAVCPE